MVYITAYVQYQYYQADIACTITSLYNKLHLLCTQKKLTNKKATNFLQERKGDLVVACHSPPLKKEKVKKQGITHPFSPIPSLNPTFVNRMELSMGNGMSPSFFACLRGGVQQAITKSLLIFQRKCFAFL